MGAARAILSPVCLYTSPRIIKQADEMASVAFIV